jgi:RNA recognition motif-containing protein
MKNNLFVQNLAWATTDESLRAHFEKIGEVLSAKVILNRDSGQSRGFGFVEMVDDQKALEAIDSLNESDLDGRTIHVFHAKEKSE